MLKVYDRILRYSIGWINDDTPNPHAEYYWKYNTVLTLAMFMDDMFEFTSELKDSDIVLLDLDNVGPYEDFTSEMPDDLRQEIIEADVTAIMPGSCYHVQENYNTQFFKRAQVPVYSKIDVPDSNMGFCIKKTGMRFCYKDFSAKANSPFNRVIMLHTNETSKAIPSNDYEVAYTDFYFNLAHTFYFNNKNPKLIDNWNVINPHGKYTSGVDWFAHDYNTEYWDLTPDEKLVNWNKFEGSTHRRPDRIYVCPNNTRYRVNPDNDPEKINNGKARGDLRAELINLLRDYPGYTGDPHMGTPLISNKSSVSDDDVLCLHGRGYAPPHNAYYDMSSISFYVESLTYLMYPDEEPVYCATEKTWMPILKGHFILPFGPEGYCNYLKSEYDIKFPDFIDLSYDQIDNNSSESFDPQTNLQFWHEGREARWKLYLAEVKRLCEEYSARELYELKEKNLDLLIHNRNLIRKGPRHDLTKLFKNQLPD